MIRYHFRCKKCEEDHYVWMSHRDDKPLCGRCRAPMEHVLSPLPIHKKGSGWTENTGKGRQE